MGEMMNYSKSGGASTAKPGPRPKRMNSKGAPPAKADDKAALLARMKAASMQKPPAKPAKPSE
ncbi:hypothetical protein LHP98_10305 [Rhodobacter sp. Har01]|uniref:hypothetical protein n=1 Tax=Rhodobacter sp. Har01 TaxID=2883999 RepID=UPI001D060A17|nr:hypothetical protein [Rhodobacter sp. Har01]MCB6178523.1 hypothetical protein [Rhodobacter sp. Har01]